MESFLNEHFLLKTATAQSLYRDYAADCPIIDYHCHIDPKDIAEDITFENITQLWLGHDHYKWRLMRAAGVPEELITGDAGDREKFNAWAFVIGRSFGNPLFHWSHLELLRYFGFSGSLSEKTADEVWALTLKKLSSPGFSARGLIQRSQVKILCTTDDPVDNLLYHQQIASDSSFPTRVLPTFRPDRAIDIEKNDFTEYLALLEKELDSRICSLSALQDALYERMKFFAENGCRLSDHGLTKLVYAKADPGEVEGIFLKRLSGAGRLTSIEVAQYQTAMLLFCAKAYDELGWTMQLHFGCRRDNNRVMGDALGANTGFDAISGDEFVTSLAQFLDHLEQANALPRMIVYSLNPNDNILIDALLACFQKGPSAGRLQHGSAWWFNDNERGMRDQLLTLASQSYLPGFIGMLTDSRSFVSYTRHEYFRRLLCDVIGQAIEEGSFPNDRLLLGSMIRDICYGNAERLFS